MSHCPRCPTSPRVVSPACGSRGRSARPCRSGGSRSRRRPGPVGTSCASKPCWHESASLGACAPSGVAGLPLSSQLKNTHKRGGRSQSVVRVRVRGRDGRRGQESGARFLVPAHAARVAGLRLGAFAGEVPGTPTVHARHGCRRLRTGQEQGAPARAAHRTFRLRLPPEFLRLRPALKPRNLRSERPAWLPADPRAAPPSGGPPLLSPSWPSRFR